MSGILQTEQGPILLTEDGSAFLADVGSSSPPLELPDFTAEEFATQFQEEMPTGAVWPREPDTVQRAAVLALMPTYVRSWEAARSLPLEALPSMTFRLLPEWEASLGLPDPCAGEDPTNAVRQAHVVARFTEADGPSIPSITSFAAALGYAITIDEFVPARADFLVADGPVNDPSWAFAWQINYAGTTISYFAADMSFADDPLATWGNSVLECEIRRIKPAHTQILFNYTSPVSAALWDSSQSSEGWDAGGWIT